MIKCHLHAFVAIIRYTIACTYTDLRSVLYLPIAVDNTNTNIIHVVLIVEQKKKEEEEEESTSKEGGQQEE